MVIDIKGLLNKSKPVEMTSVKANVNKQHYTIITDAGIDPELLIKEAFRDVAEALEKDSILKRLAPTNSIKERIVHAERGDIGPRGPTMKDRIVTALDDPEQSMTADEIAHKIRSDNVDSVRATIAMLLQENILDGSSDRPKRYFMKKHGDPELRNSLPKGEKISYLG